MLSNCFLTGARGGQAWDFVGTVMKKPEVFVALSRFAVYNDKKQGEGIYGFFIFVGRYSYAGIE